MEPPKGGREESTTTQEGGGREAAPHNKEHAETIGHVYLSRSQQCTWEQQPAAHGRVTMSNVGLVEVRPERAQDEASRQSVGAETQRWLESVGGVAGELHQGTLATLIPESQ